MINCTLSEDIQHAAQTLTTITAQATATATAIAEAQQGDNSFSPVALLLQAIITIVTLLIGYGLSLFSERRSWQRRKAEQIRDRQLLVLQDLVSAITDILVVGYKIRDKTSEFRNILGQVEQSSTALYARLLSVRKSVDPMIDDWKALRRQIQRDASSLRLFRFADQGQAIASQAVNLALDLEAVIIDAFAEDRPNGLSEYEKKSSSLENGLKDFDRLLSELLSRGVPSLHG